MLEHKRGMALNDGTAHTVSLHFLCLRSMTKNAWKRNLHAHSLYKQWIFFWSAIKSRIDKQWPIPFNFMVSFFFICPMFCVPCFFCVFLFQFFLSCVWLAQSLDGHTVETVSYFFVPRSSNSHFSVLLSSLCCPMYEFEYVLYACWPCPRQSLKRLFQIFTSSLVSNFFPLRWMCEEPLETQS